MVLVRLPSVLLIALLLGACGGNDDPVVHPDSAPVPDAPPMPDGPLPPDGPPPPPGTGCSVAIDLTNAPAPEMHNNQFSGNGNGASCSGGADSAPELYFTYDAGATAVDLLVDVMVDESVPAPFDVVLSARTDCNDAMTEVACADVGWGEHMEVLEVTGVVAVLVDGSTEFGGAPAGDFTIRIVTRAIAGLGEACDPAGLTSRCGTDMVCSGTCVATSAMLACLDAVDLTADLADGSAQAGGTVLLTDPDYYQGTCAFDVSANYPERIYRIDLAASGLLAASTDFPETTYDTVLYLKAGACDVAETTCQDDVDAPAMNYRSSVSASLPAGAYYLFVDMSSGFLYGTPGVTPRSYRVDLTFTPD